MEKEELGIILVFIVSIGVFGFVLWGLTGDIVSNYTLASLNDGSQTTGSFMLGSGTLRSDPVFVYYRYENDGKSMVLRTISSSYSYIIEDSDFAYLAVHRNNNGNVKSAIFHVPKGTVIKNMVLDGKL